ncbi:S-adenosylmethionine decarboxylase [Pseudothermotoga hypogea DSM 11164 = NBRC 106472]|uniref:S-adenosylmethionine decarboxylase proenzyme n=1 Tax=Pseudothermotoga hypogea DSM 11164 = NBRC 106472 TaxID=1123384 RepID=A0A0X1KTF3_9THEM|nr:MULTISPECIES: adenosylmethionine decarboxylase [Pseudothermotoga]AJC74545.1 S-adenosylmethionine decarboxylase [Pseudothermotoga hypogea DSM 11164 = NBRC 106472]MBC7123580.1 S-adenosylmethionine decarboxylase proenzyme [Pseudothermotoga sp.]MDI6862123.1 adenosylmethionine decarboxylase [Pseudothermotoga sp.]
MEKSLGRHLIAEFYDCDPQAIDDVEFVEEKMKNAAIIAGATIVGSSFHRFLPYGVSGVVVISESHLTIHTWPEYRYAAIDLFTCGEDTDPWKAFEYLKQVFKAKRTQVFEHLRGDYRTIGIPFEASHKAVKGGVKHE